MGWAAAPLSNQPLSRVIAARPLAMYGQNGDSQGGPPRSNCQSPQVLANASWKPYSVTVLTSGVPRIATVMERDVARPL